VFAILFSLVYLSDSDIVKSSKKQMLIQELQTATRANAGVSRMIEPDNICFTVDQRILDKYPSLADSIKQADTWAQIDIKTDSRYGNYYSGVGLNLNKTQMLSLISEYNGFNQTVYEYTTPDNLFTNQDRHFTCGFTYHQKYYNVDLTFTMLKQVNRDGGYVPIHITRALIEKKLNLQTPDETTFAPFNNTIVFFNDLSSPLNVEVTNENETAAEGTTGTMTIAIPANKKSDLRLGPNWNSLDSVIYHYKVNEYPWIEGEISVSPRYNSECMTKEIAKSLYAQSDFEVKFPSHLPEGFRLACNGESTGDYVIQIYVNQTAEDHYKNKGEMHSLGNPYPFYIYESTPDDDAKGIFHIHAQKYYLNDPVEQQHDYYQFLLNNTSAGSLTNPNFFEMNGISYLTYNEGSLSHVDVVVNESHERYRLVGALPIDEMIKIAKSLS
jgi:hypothetical protein